MHKPRVTVNPVANAYTGDSERIIEFSDPQIASGDGNVLPGGLISVRRNGDRLVVRLYRMENVDVRVEQEPHEPTGRHASPQAWRRLRAAIGVAEARDVAADIAAVVGCDPKLVDTALSDMPWDRKKQL